MNDDELLIKYIETTSKCNYACPICVERTRNCTLPMDDFYKIIDKNIDLFYKKAIWMDFNGEPLVDPYFFDRIDYMHQNNINTRISTNGALLNEENRNKIATSNISYVVVSVGTLDKEEYKKIRGIDNLETVLNNLFELKKCIDKCHSNTQLQAVMIDTGNIDIDKCIELFHQHGIDVGFHNFTNRSNSIKLDINPKNRENNDSQRGVCKGLKSNNIILSNCEVVNCCCDFFAKNSLGNLKEYDYSLEELMKNGKLDRIIENLENGIYEGACKDCSDWIYYQDGSEEEYVTVYPVEKENERQKIYSLR